MKIFHEPSTNAPAVSIASTRYDAHSIPHQRNAPQLYPCKNAQPAIIYLDDLRSDKRRRHLSTILLLSEMKPYLLNNDDEAHEWRLKLVEYFSKKRGRNVPYAEVLRELQREAVRKLKL